MFDDNARHIAAWNGGHSPVFEPGLSQLVADVKGARAEWSVRARASVRGVRVRALVHPCAPTGGAVCARACAGIVRQRENVFCVPGKNLTFTTDFKSMIDRAEVIFVSVRRASYASHARVLAHCTMPAAAVPLRFKLTGAHFRCQRPPRSAGARQT